MKTPSVLKEYLGLRQALEAFYAYSDVVLTLPVGTRTAVRRAYLFATFTAALQVTTAYDSVVATLRLQPPSPMRTEQLERVQHQYAYFQRTLAVLRQSVRHTSGGDVRRATDTV